VRRRRTLAASLALLLIGLVLILTWRPGQTTTAVPTHGLTGNGSPSIDGAAMPPAWLAWMPGGFPTGSRTKVAALDGVERSVFVAGDTMWMTTSADASGAVVDRPSPPYAIPIDAFAVDPHRYEPFMPPTYRASVTAALEQGKAVLGSTSAALRRLGVGGRLTFGTGSVDVGAVVPDRVVGWSEMLVSRTAGARLGIVDDRYLLAQMRSAETDAGFLAALGPLLPSGSSVRVAAPGEVRYVRVASGSAPPVVLKRVFGEFAAYPDPSDPISLRIDPHWYDAHIRTDVVPVLGRETCNAALFPALIGAMRELRARGLAGLVRSNAGCYNPELLAATPTAPPSFHAYGAAIDINAPQNPFGVAPHQDPRLVYVMQRWGFDWGGRFLVPDGMHFEYLSPPHAG
jgi:hypothetical protein